MRYKKLKIRRHPSSLTEKDRKCLIFFSKDELCLITVERIHNVEHDRVCTKCPILKIGRVNQPTKIDCDRKKIHAFSRKYILMHPGYFNLEDML